MYWPWSPARSFIGSILGGGGTLDLASGTGTLIGLLTGSFTDGGPTTSFSNFGVLEVGAGASFTASGTGSVAAGQSLIVAGSLTETGSLAVSGTLSGTGTFTVGGGTTSFSGTPTLTIARVGESAAAAVIAVNTTLLTASGVWTQTAGTVSVGASDKVNFTGTSDVFSGTLSGAGTVGFTAGTDTLSGTHIAAATTISSAGVTLSGAITLTKTLSVSSTGLTIAAAGVTLSGVGGILSLSNLATNVVKGATVSALLTTSSGFKIIGAGQLGDGQMGLSNAAGAIIEASVTNALIINLGANTLSNAGLIENISTGGLTITGAVINTGALTVTKGVLSVGGAVTGAGVVNISGGGTADFASGFTENVTFASTGGVLGGASPVADLPRPGHRLRQDQRDQARTFSTSTSPAGQLKPPSAARPRQGPSPSPTGPTPPTSPSWATTRPRPGPFPATAMAGPPSSIPPGPPAPSRRSPPSRWWPPWPGSRLRPRIALSWKSGENSTQPIWFRASKPSRRVRAAA